MENEMETGIILGHIISCLPYCPGTHGPMESSKLKYCAFLNFRANLAGMPMNMMRCFECFGLRKF